jgi:hypothetical protein
VASALGLVLGVKTVLEQRVLMLIGHQNHVAAAPAVAAAGSPARNILLPPEGQTAVAAVAGLHEDDDFIDEHRKAAGERPAASRNSCGGAALRRWATRLPSR